MPKPPVHAINPPSNSYAVEDNPISLTDQTMGLMLAIEEYNEEFDNTVVEGLIVVVKGSEATTHRSESKFLDKSNDH